MKKIAALMFVSGTASAGALVPVSEPSTLPLIIAGLIVTWIATRVKK